MKWTVGINEAAAKQLRKLGPVAAKKIRAYLAERIEGTPDPRAYGKPLRGDLTGLWRYRVEDYRIIARLEDHRLIVLVVTVGHRSDVYEA